MNVKYRDIKNGFHLNSRQKAIIVGTLLGDGNLTKHGKHFRLFVKHAARQSKLAEWKRSEFQEITRMKINFFKQRVKDKIYEFCQFVTLTHSEFDNYRKIFYRKNKKIVPVKIDKILIHSLSLAVWIMDDGAKDNAGMTIQTHSFSSADVRRIQKCLKIKFRISATIRSNKGKDIIYIPKNQVKRLYGLVKKYLLPEYKYKFPLAL